MTLSEKKSAELLGNEKYFWSAAFGDVPRLLIINYLRRIFYRTTGWKYYSSTVENS
jgi:hypothetical protein